MFDSTSIAFAAGGAFVAGLVALARRAASPPWIVWGALSLAFLAFSTLAIVTEGPTGFWPEHTRHLWGNQIWFDLLLAGTVAWAALVPRLRKAGMTPLPWAALIVATGSIGLLAMFARLSYLEREAR